MVGNVNNNNYENYYNSCIQKKQDTGGNKFLANMSSAATKVDQSDDTDRIGVTMINDGTNTMWGASARYAINSTEDNPIVQVSTNYGGESVVYNVNINEIDPRNASELEMFALGSYADDKGMGTSSSFGTYQTMKVFKMNAGINGDAEASAGLEDFLNEKMDWVSMCEKMMKNYFEAGVLKQYKDGMVLMDLFSKFPC